MSKTLGNVVNPLEMVEKYSADALRYYCLAKISPFQDGDFSEEKLKEAFNSDLANGLGNLVARVAKLAEKHSLVISKESETTEKSNEKDFSPSYRNDKTTFVPEVQKLLEEFKFNDALSLIWSKITIADQQINETKPWELEGEKAKAVLTDLCQQIIIIANNLQPFLPETSEKILKQFSGEIKSQTSLFPRIA